MELEHPGVLGGGTEKGYGMSQFTMVGTYTLVTCYKCSIAFAVPDEFDTARRRDHTSFYCPAGHGQVYKSKSDVEQLREEVAIKQRSAEFWQRRSEEKAREVVSANHRLRATRGVVTKIKRRVGKGVCPCCNRTFRDLARHMEGQHPEFAKVEA